MADDDFLRRWSRRKAQAKAIPPQSAAASEFAAALPIADADAAPPAPVAHPASGAPLSAPAGNTQPAHAAATPAAAPPDPSTLEPGADISSFMARGVDEALRRRALKTLFQDPRYNVMDGLDTYIDDYSIPDPMPPEWLDKLEQLSHLGDRAGRDREAAEQAALEADAAGAAEAGMLASGAQSAVPEPGAQTAASDAAADAAAAHSPASMGEPAAAVDDLPAGAPSPPPLATS